MSDLNLLLSRIYDYRSEGNVNISQLEEIYVKCLNKIIRNT